MKLTDEEKNYLLTQIDYELEFIHEHYHVIENPELDIMFYTNLRNKLENTIADDFQKVNNGLDNIENEIDKILGE